MPITPNKLSNLVRDTLLVVFVPLDHIPFSDHLPLGKHPRGNRTRIRILPLDQNLPIPGSVFIRKITFDLHIQDCDSCR